MSLGTVTQLYTDLETVFKKTGVMLVAENTAALFNANLDEAKKEYPNDPILTAIEEADSKVHISDLLTRAGQLKQVLEDNQDHSPVVIYG